MIGLPRVERARRLAGSRGCTPPLSISSAIAATIRSTIASSTENVSSATPSSSSVQTMRAPLGLGELDDDARCGRRGAAPSRSRRSRRSGCARPPAAPMPRSRSAYTVPRAITNSTRSLASRVMMSSVSPSATRRCGARRAVDERHDRDGGAAPRPLVEPARRDRRARGRRRSTLAGATGDLPPGGAAGAARRRAAATSRALPARTSGSSPPGDPPRPGCGRTLTSASSITSCAR